MIFDFILLQKTPEGYTGLGIMYFKGMGVQKVLYKYVFNDVVYILKDYVRAMEYFLKAAEKGSQEAHLYIGISYLCK